MGGAQNFLAMSASRILQKALENERNRNPEPISKTPSGVTDDSSISRASSTSARAICAPSSSRDWSSTQRLPRQVQAASFARDQNGVGPDLDNRGVKGLREDVSALERCLAQPSSAQYSFDDQQSELVMKKAPPMPGTLMPAVSLDLEPDEASEDMQVLATYTVEDSLYVSSLVQKAPSFTQLQLATAAAAAAMVTDRSARRGLSKSASFASFGMNEARGSKSEATKYDPEVDEMPLIGEQIAYFAGFLGMASGNVDTWAAAASGETHVPPVGAGIGSDVNGKGGALVGAVRHNCEEYVSLMASM